MAKHAVHVIHAKARSASIVPYLFLFSCSTYFSSCFMMGSSFLSPRRCISISFLYVKRAPLGGRPFVHVSRNSMNHAISIERSEALSPRCLPVNLRIGSSLIPLPPSSFSLPLRIARVPALAAALNRRLVAAGRRGAAPAASLSLASLLEDLGRPPQTLPSFVFLPLFHRHPRCLLPRCRPPSKFDISGEYPFDSSRLYLPLPSMALLSPHPLDLPAAQSSRRPPPLAAAILHQAASPPPLPAVRAVGEPRSPTAFLARVPAQPSLASLAAPPFAVNDAPRLRRGRALATVKEACPRLDLVRGTPDPQAPPIRAWGWWI